MDFVTKLFLAMRLTAVLLITGLLQVQARGLAQNVTYTARGVPLTKVFAVIKQQTGYLFFYSPQELQDSRPVTCEWKNLPIQAALENLFAAQPLSFDIQGNTVVVSKADKPLASSTAVSTLAPPGSITGKVTDSTGAPLEGASVTVKGQKGKGVVTNAKGEFELKRVDDHSTLIISFTGYVSLEVKLTDANAVSIRLVHSNSQLDQVQVVAYGQTTERMNTGDVTTIKSDVLDKQPVSDPILALEGRVPGLLITQGTGFSGSSIKVQILGQNSMANGNDPFYVIDGVPYTSELLPGISYVQNGGNLSTPSPFTFISPADIESISVLKDADATSIYGSRAANGAILITTKKGKVGQTKVDINMQDGWGQVDRKLSLLNLPQYLQMRHEALQNDGIVTPAETDYDINGLWDTTRNTNWQKTLIGGTSQYTNIAGSVSGGTTNTQFLLGASYHRETTVFPGDLSDQKGSLHFNINNASANQRFKLQFSGSYLFDDNVLPGVDLTSTAVRLSPDAPKLYNSDGSLNWSPDQNGNSSWNNPLAYLTEKSEIKTNNLISNAVISYSITTGLSLKSSFGYTNLQSFEIFSYPSTSAAPENRGSFERSSYFEQNHTSSWIIEPFAEYNKIIENVQIQTVIGTSIQENTSLGQFIYASGFNSDLQLGDVGSAATLTASTVSPSVYRYSAAFSRINFNWQEKYILNMTARRDGSSRFGSANQFHDFESVGAAWIFSKEPVVQKNISAISFGKLAVSYGTTGNDQIGNYTYLSLYNSISVPTPYQGSLGLQPSSLSNPYLQWEETRKMRLGLDIGFLHDAILLNSSYFLTRSSNQLLPSALPWVTGFGSITENFPATVQNSGWEFTVNTVNFKGKNFSWKSNLNLTIPRNKLVSFPDLESSSYAYSYVIGKPLAILKVLDFKGVQPSTGIYQFEGAQGVTTNPNYSTDLNTIVNLNPAFYGGFENTFAFKGFQLDIFFHFIRQRGINYYFGNSDPGSFSGAGNYGNQPSTVLGRWQKPGDLKSIQQYNSDLNLLGSFFNAEYSDRAYSDASFIRLKNISLAWQFPKKMTDKIKVDNIRLYVHAQNLLTFSRYVGLDPETLSSGTLPPLKVVTIGLQVVL